MGIYNFLDNIYRILLSKSTKEKSERAILWIALVSFVIHLLIIELVHFDIIHISEPSNLLLNPIAAIYTPFSFILVYEVYLLIYYLPKSYSTYISKQYEIVALLIIRRLFKDLSDLSLSSNWFNIKNDLQFTYDLLASIILFYLIYLFHIQRAKAYRYIESYKNLQAQFIKRKVKKRYVALLDGIVKQPEGIINLPLRVDLDNRPNQIVCYDYGKPAQTHWEVIERRAHQTLVYFYPITGRTHQLRVHAAHNLGLNTPIVGDDLYGNKANRLHLHAESITFSHPISRETVTITIAPDF